MDRTSTFVIGGLLAAGTGLFLFLLFTSGEDPRDAGELPHDHEIIEEWATAPAEYPSATTKDISVTPHTVVTAKHAYRSGTHIIAGEIPLPTPCHLLEARGSSSSDKMSVQIEIMSSIKTGEICAQVITPARFKVSVKAPQNARLSAVLNGQSVTLNLIEAGPEEDLDNFELYIKG